MGMSPGLSSTLQPLDSRAFSSIKPGGSTDDYWTQLKKKQNEEFDILQYVWTIKAYKVFLPGRDGCEVKDSAPSSSSPSQLSPVKIPVETQHLIKKVEESEPFKERSLKFKKGLHQALPRSDQKCKETKDNLCLRIAACLIK